MGKINRSIKLRRILAVFFFIVFTITIFIVVFCFFGNKCFFNTNKLNFEPKVIVQDYVRFSVKPIKISTKGIITFRILIESEQNPEFLRQNLKEIFLLEDDQLNPFKPYNWEILEKSKYHILGNLTFDLGRSSLKSFKLSIFCLDVISMEWNLNSKEGQYGTK